MHAKCKNLEAICREFENASSKTLALWSSAISAHVEHRNNLSALDLFRDMLQAKVFPDREVCLCILKACTKLGYFQQARVIHSVIIWSSLEVDKSIGNLLVHVYVKSGSLADAQAVFDRLHTRDVVAWSALIGGYAEQGHGVEALQLYENSILGGVRPNRVTFFTALKACGSIGAFIEGLLIHDQICRTGTEINVTLASSLIDTYAKCGMLDEARCVFDGAPQGAVVPWNALLCGYVLYGRIADAVRMIKKMERQGIKPSEVTFLTMLKACHSFGTLVFGRIVHDETIRSSFSSSVTIANALVDMYGKCGSLEEAKQVFSTLAVRNLLSWSALIDGCARHGQPECALEHYMRMQEDLCPDEATLSSVLRACTALGSVEQGELIHNQIIRCKLETDLVVGSALVDMYAKSGFLQEAQNVLGHLPSRNAVSWGALIAGYTYYGNCFLAIKAFWQMQTEGTQPDEATLVCTLRVAASLGDVNLGMLLHHQLIIQHFDLDAHVGTALVDMYAKSACLKEARRVFDEQKERDAVTWGALVGGYVFCKEFEMAYDCLSEMHARGLKLPDAIYTSLISGCSYQGQITDGKQHFRNTTRGYDNIEQCTAMVDLLGRAGSLDEAVGVLHTMPPIPDHVSWTSYLTGCRIYGNMDQNYDEFLKATHSFKKPSTV